MLSDNPAPSDDLVKDTTTAAFRQDVLAESMQQPVLVDFWAPWCGPCRVIAPILDKLAGEYEGRLKIAKVNTDEEIQHASQLGIQGIPTLIIFKAGKEVDSYQTLSEREREVLKYTAEGYTAQEIADLEGVTEVYSVAGDADLVAMVRVREHEELADVIADRVNKVTGVTGTNTHIAFRTYSQHDLESAFKVGERIALLYDGRIHVAVTPDELLASTDPVVQRFIRRGRVNSPVSV